MISATLHPRINSPEGAEAIFIEANRGVPRAMRMAAVLNAGGVQGDRNWPTALDWLQAAAQRSDSDAEGELVALCHDEGLIAHMTALARKDIPFPADIWKQLRQGVDLKQLLATPTQTIVLSETPLVVAVTDLATPNLCAWLRGRAEPHLKPGADYAEMEFNLGNTGLPLMALRERIAGLLRTPNLLPTVIRRLRKPDLTPAVLGAYTKNESGPAPVEQPVPPDPEDKASPATASLRLFLNEDYRGGHIDFPHLGIGYRGKLGHALFWADSFANGEADPKCESSVQMIHEGEQWVLAQRSRGPDVSD